MSPNVLGLDRLAALDSVDRLKGFWVGKVVNDGAEDSMGRIKARIEALFGDDKEGISDDDLPWIQMMPSCGLYVRPQVDDFVTVMFQGSIYEGFYVGHTVNMQSKSENSDGGTFGGQLNDYFFLNFHNSFIKGKYDGSEFELNVNKNTTVKIDGDGNVNVEQKSAGNLNIKTAGDVNIDAAGTAQINSAKAMDITSDSPIIIKGTPSVKIDHSTVADLNGVGTQCGIPFCLFTGAPHVGKTATG